MSKLIAIGPIIFVLSLILLRYSLVEQWTIEDRFWEPDGTNLMQDRLDFLDTLGGVSILGIFVGAFMPVIGLYFGFPNEK